MPSLNTIATFSLWAGLACASVKAAEDNVWPVWTATTSPGSPYLQSTALGPLFFEQMKADGAKVSGLRPLIVINEPAKGTSKDVYSLYPLLSYHEDPESWRLSVFSLLRATGSKTGQQKAKAGDSFELWPFYFHRNNPAVGDQYTAVFPLYGDVTHRFGDDKWSFRLFPLYSRSEANGRVVTQTPWPLIRRIEGAGHKGLEVFPLFGYRERPGDYRNQFYLWPLVYKNETHLSDPVPSVKQGFLPFYASTDGQGEKSRTYVWPFFGYSDRTEPYRYHQTNYFWPLLVQGKGDQREVNRWAPFYTHSVIKGREKTWVAWPLWRKTSAREGNVQETETKVGLVVFKNTEQRSLTNPSAAPANRTHLWPLMSSWNNGAGKKQLQVLSPLEPLFSNNDAVRQTWTPFFALYRYNQANAEDYQHSLLWNLATFRKQGERKEFHLGPLLATETGPQARVSLAAGLLGVAKGDDGRWKPFLFHFKRRSTPVKNAQP